jgi:hypothetical protein
VHFWSSELVVSVEVHRLHLVVRARDFHLILI